MIKNGIQGRDKKAAPQALGEMFLIHPFYYYKNIYWNLQRQVEKLNSHAFFLTQAPLLMLMKAVKFSFKPKPLIPFNSS